MTGEIKNFFVELLFPSSCYGCKKPGTYLCKKCHTALDAFPHPLCLHCSKRAPFGVLNKQCSKELGLERLFVCAPYKNDILNRMIKDLKYKGSFKLSRPLASFMCRYLKKEAYAKEITTHTDIVLPVPMHVKKQKLRGYNHAEHLARDISEILSIPYAHNIIKKHKKTISQVEAGNLAEREKNLTGSFSVPESSLVKNKIVLLIDDVATTGSTLKECAEVLRRSGAKEVWALTLAKD
ncbi:MAG: ComF family protein [Candidatus Spechtbacterales bacterium]